jgi:hypothetical protein
MAIKTETEDEIEKDKERQWMRDLERSRKKTKPLVGTLWPCRECFWFYNQ